MKRWSERLRPFESSVFCSFALCIAANSYSYFQWRLVSVRSYVRNREATKRTSRVVGHGEKWNASRKNKSLLHLCRRWRKDKKCAFGHSYIMKLGDVSRRLPTRGFLLLLPLQQFGCRMLRSFCRDFLQSNANEHIRKHSFILDFSTLFFLLGMKISIFSLILYTARLSCCHIWENDWDKMHHRNSTRKRSACRRANIFHSNSAWATAECYLHFEH